MSEFVKGLVHRRTLLSLIELAHPEVSEDENEPYEISFNIDEISTFEESDEDNYLIYLKNSPFDIEDFFLTSNKGELDKAIKTH